MNGLFDYLCYMDKKKPIAQTLCLIVFAEVSFLPEHSKEHIHEENQPERVLEEGAYIVASATTTVTGPQNT